MPVDVEAEVLRNTRLSDDYNVVALAAPAIAGAVDPGQFVMIKAARGLDPLLRRPFSVFEILRSGDAPVGISLLSKRIGRSTSLLYDLQPGDRVACLGPLGRGFTVPDAPTEAWMVAGGVGLAPFLSLAERLRERRTPTRLFYGGRRAQDLYYLDAFERLGCDLILSTEDGSGGTRGFITAPLERELAAAGPARDLVLCACGPTAMMRAVAGLAERFGRRCEVSLEQVMGCGLGGCYSCVVATRTASGSPHFLRTCIDGPVLESGTVVWDALDAR